nr:immunoglobulin heavy chain junction region [Macaca mulatta]
CAKGSSASAYWYFDFW